MRVACVPPAYALFTIFRKKLRTYTAYFAALQSSTYSASVIDVERSQIMARDLGDLIGCTYN